ncbi:MAG: ABC transporter substrate-binding protein, partial [Candidatus Acidiferrales bacterium]
MSRRFEWEGGFSFTSFASPASLSSLAPFASILTLLLLLSSCSRTVSTVPGVVNFEIESMPTNLDPRIGTDGPSERIDGLLFDSLVELDEHRIPHGDLAERWEMPDPVTYVFHLRPGVKFHDGRVLTSADVKYTFDSILNRTVTSPKRGAFALIKSVEAPDPATVIFHLSEPDGGFLVEICRPAIGIVPAGSGSDFGSHPIGTGPFRFVEARQDDHVLLERNPDYFRAPAKISKLNFRVVPEAIVRALELRKGSADLELTSLTPDVISAMRSDPGIEITEQAGNNYSYIVFNFDDPILAKLEVREALAYATDRKEIIRYLLRGEAREADGPLPPSSWAYEPDIRHFAYDPKEAERLLDQAGLPRSAAGDHMRFQVTLKTSTEESARLLGLALQEQWHAVGVDLELRPMEIATLFSDLTQGSFQLSTLRWLGVNSDPEFFEYAFSSKRIPPAGANRGRYRNPTLDALLDQARTETDPEKRKELFGEIQKMVAENVPYLSLWYQDNICVHRKRIRNVHLSPTGDYDFVRFIEAE